MEATAGAPENHLSQRVTITRPVPTALMTVADLGPPSAEDDISLDALLIRDDDVFNDNLDLADFVESLVPIIKDLIAHNKLLDLITTLSNNVNSKNTELNSLSMNLAGEMNACSDNINTVHTKADSLRRKLLAISRDIEKSLVELTRRKARVVKSREVYERIQETTTVLSLCIQVLEVTNRIHELIKQKKYFIALKLIDELTNIHLPKVETFSFAIKIYESIPTLTNMIKTESFENLLTWLALNLERKLDTIGDAVYGNLYDLQRHWTDFKSQNPGFEPHKLNSPVEMSLRDPTINDWRGYDPELELSMDTVFDAILVYETLNEVDLLAEMFHKEWINKYNRIIYPITLATDLSLVRFNSLAALEAYLRKISAFFVMDRHINISTRFQLRSHANSNDLWELYAIKLKPVLLSFLETISPTSLSELEQLKKVVGDFLLVMENHNYSKLELYQVLMDIFHDRFIPIVIKEFRGAFLDSIQSDHYMPMVVSDPQEYEEVMLVCWYDHNAPFAPENRPQLPVTLPFSLDYVHYCDGVQKLLDQVLAFIGEYYSHDSNEVNSMIVNEIFERVLGEEPGVGICRDIKDFIDKNSLNKEVAAQSYTNLVFYELSVLEIGVLINLRLREDTGSGVNNVDAQDLFRLAAAEHFLRLRKYLEGAIYSMVDAKIRDLMEMVEYDDWLPEQRNHEAMFTITDFAQFLESLFTSIFANLPKQLRTIGLFRTYDFVAQRFLAVLHEAPAYNRIAIENFDLDVKYVEDLMQNLYAMHEPDQESAGAVSLDLTFTELRQCIDLLLLDSYDEYFGNNIFRTRQFDRVKLEDGKRLIAKMQQVEPAPGLGESDAALIAPGPSTAALTFAKFSSRWRTNTDG